MTRNIFLIFVAIFLMGCSATQVTNFQECVDAGNPVMESYPRQCKHLDSTFTEVIDESLCEDLCGDNQCQEMVCMGQGCPCAESVKSCPSDCN